MLCVSIVWAAVGLPMIGFGLVCLLIAERRKKQPIAVVVTRSDPLDRRQEPPSLPIEESAPSAKLVEVSPGRMKAQQAPSAHPASRQPRAPKPALTSRKEPADRRRNEPDLEKWSRLVKIDADISRSVEALQPFGRKYVDQLATAHLAFGEKSYLPTIVKLVADAIKKGLWPGSGERSRVRRCREHGPDQLCAEQGAHLRCSTGFRCPGTQRWLCGKALCVEQGLAGGRTGCRSEAGGGSIRIENVRQPARGRGREHEAS